MWNPDRREIKLANYLVVQLWHVIISARPAV